jgi:tetratricopeptide (TPR) repeat protein
LRRDKTFAPAHSGRALAYRVRGNLDQALADFNEALTLDPHLATLYADRGATYFALGNVDKAIADYDQAIGRNTNVAASYNLRGLAYFTTGDFGQGARRFRRRGCARPRIRGGVHQPR